MLKNVWFPVKLLVNTVQLFDSFLNFLSCSIIYSNSGEIVLSVDEDFVISVVFFLVVLALAVIVLVCIDFFVVNLVVNVVHDRIVDVRLFGSLVVLSFNSILFVLVSPTFVIKGFLVLETWPDTIFDVEDVEFNVLIFTFIVVVGFLVVDV